VGKESSPLEIELVVNIMPFKTKSLMLLLTNVFTLVSHFLKILQNQFTIIVLPLSGNKEVNKIMYEAGLSSI
tara:strand:+ start:29 stop:244 length:216 start_codon:yes stop_codon:yes gene_type:complete